MDEQPPVGHGHGVPDEQEVKAQPAELEAPVLAKPVEDEPTKEKEKENTKPDEPTAVKSNGAAAKTGGVVGGVKKVATGAVGGVKKVLESKAFGGEYNIRITPGLETVWLVGIGLDADMLGRWHEG